MATASIQVHAKLLRGLAIIGLLISFGCATPEGSVKWIQTGKTTRAEVLERYGEPDLVQVFADGETVTYRPLQRPPSIEIPVARAGPSGLTTTQTQTLNPGLGVKEVAAGTDKRPNTEIRIHYDRQGIVREISN